MLIFFIFIFRHLLLAIVRKDILNLCGPLVILKAQCDFFVCLFASTNFCRRGNGRDQTVLVFMFKVVV